MSILRRLVALFVMLVATFLCIPCFIVGVLVIWPCWFVLDLGDPYEAMMETSFWPVIVGERILNKFGLI